MIRKIMYGILAVVVCYIICAGILYYKYCGCKTLNMMHSGRDVRYTLIYVDFKKCDYFKQKTLLKSINAIMVPTNYVLENITMKEWVDDGGLNSIIIKDVKSRNFNMNKYIIYNENGENAAVVFLNKNKENKFSVVLNYDNAGKYISERIY